VKPGTGLTVAVKTLNHDGLQGHKEWLVCIFKTFYFLLFYLLYSTFLMIILVWITWQAEVSFLGDLVHPNLVKLVGYCIEGDQRLLVYEFMPRGSLENHLFRSKLPFPM